MEMDLPIWGSSTKYVVLGALDPQIGHFRGVQKGVQKGPYLDTPKWGHLEGTHLEHLLSRAYWAYGVIRETPKWANMRSPNGSFGPSKRGQIGPFGPKACTAQLGPVGCSCHLEGVQMEGTLK